MAGDYYYDDDDGGEGARRWLKLAVIGVVAAAVVAGTFWVVTRDDEGPSAVLTNEPTTTVEPAVLPAPAGTTPAPPSAPLPTSAAPATTIAATTTATHSGSAETTAAPPTPGTAANPTTTSSSPEPTEPTAPQSGEGPGYPTSADGTPLPVIVTFEPEVITITGFVPSQAAKDRLGALAIANSKTDARLENNVIINENVPIGVGVRVIELDAARFPEGSDEILPAHATELERVATVMNALPHITVVVIGHADQRGDEATNYELSAERAVAVVNFLTFLGVSPTRMSARAAGESDLLTLADDDTALALNRRTEFVFYGLLIE